MECRDRTTQIVKLKEHALDLESIVRNQQEEIRLLKLKLLTSEDLAKVGPYAPPSQMSAQIGELCSVLIATAVSNMSATQPKADPRDTEIQDLKSEIRELRYELRQVVRELSRIIMNESSYGNQDNRYRHWHTSYRSYKSYRSNHHGSWRNSNDTTALRGECEEKATPKDNTQINDARNDEENTTNGAVEVPGADEARSSEQATNNNTKEALADGETQIDRPQTGEQANTNDTKEVLDAGETQNGEQDLPPVTEEDTTHIPAVIASKTSISRSDEWLNLDYMCNMDEHVADLIIFDNSRNEVLLVSNNQITPHPGSHKVQQQATTSPKPMAQQQHSDFLDELSLLPAPPHQGRHSLL